MTVQKLKGQASIGIQKPVEVVFEAILNNFKKYVETSF